MSIARIITYVEKTAVSLVIFLCLLCCMTTAKATQHYDAEGFGVVSGFWYLDALGVEYEVSDTSIAEVVAGGRKGKQVHFLHVGDVYIKARITDPRYGMYDYTYLIHVTEGRRAARAVPADSVDRETYAQEVLELVNAERKKAGRSPLRLADDLCRAADFRATELPEKFSHTRPNGEYFNTVLPESKRYYLGENIAAGVASPAAVVDLWMHSEGHRRNILHSSYKELGVGYCFSKDAAYGHYWVQIFRG